MATNGELFCKKLQALIFELAELVFDDVLVTVVEDGKKQIQQHEHSNAEKADEVKG